jgi:predicted DNA-binding transcriptional regulator AlpA
MPIGRIGLYRVEICSGILRWWGFMKKRFVVGHSEYINTALVCSTLGIGETRLYALIKKSLLPKPLKMGRLNYWSIGDLELYFAQKQQAGQ